MPAAGTDRDPRVARVGRRVGEAVRGLDLAGRHVLVACSGGVDSSALLHLLCEAGLRVSVAHVDHGLRGAASEADAAFVAERAARLGRPFRLAKVAPEEARAGRSSRERPTLQEAARRLRYAALEAIRRELGADCIATGHTADDQAETVLLRLLRGTGPEGLGGIPTCSADGLRVRPLLRIPKAELVAWVTARGIPWREDASNRSPAYARNRLRPWIRSLEGEFNPQLLRAIGDLAEAQQREGAWIRGLVEREAASRFASRDGGLEIEGKDWSELPDALALRLARHALHACGVGRHASRVHLERMLGFLRGGRAGARLELPGGWVLTRRNPGGGFLLARAKLEGQ